MSYLNKIKSLHPCFGAKKNKGRIHLPVCPACNIECKFCDRKINDYENRPGVAATILKPEEAAESIGRALKLCPEITVAGIAGPGDALASDGAMLTFRLIKEHYPDLLKCMSTNGLLLNERAEELIELGIDTLTVTVNAIDPQIQAQIISGIRYHGKRYEGEEAARILIENQLAGIKKMTDAGVVVKVNTVLIVEINRHHIKDIAKAVSEARASMYNIIPLIPQHQLSHCREPQCIEIDEARQEAERYIDVFRHCQRCRADAVGVPGGQDFGDQIYLKRLAVKDTFSHG
ncbi:radical SAM protein [uncultured Acetobacterium sp.]|jgi:Radical SAM superfamily.|uniref:radical SAM protein n=1 Tax=uncultured Acetobacterium sp. TaxID=217139 RepID=UPI0025FDD955|nr:radical SAM protein [uncultured Acetobacterium sp.]MDD3306295.1 radical SAM protein [Acetobacterium sp.]